MNHMVKVIIYNPLSFIWMTSSFLDNFVSFDFISAENSYKTPLLHQSFGPRVFLSLSLSLSLFQADPLERRCPLSSLSCQVF